MTSIIALSSRVLRLKNKYYVLSNRACISTIILFSMSLFFLCISTAPAEAAPLIKLIEIKGNRKISDNAIFSKMKSGAGIPFSKNTVQEDIKRLYSIGHFDDIRVEIESFEGGVKLIYIFMEKPTIVSVDFQGNDELETEDLKEKITITPGAIANLSLIIDNVKKIISFYHSEGYLLVKVVPIIREISEDAISVALSTDRSITCTFSFFSC